MPHPGAQFSQCAIGAPWTAGACSSLPQAGLATPPTYPRRSLAQPLQTFTRPFLCHQPPHPPPLVLSVLSDLSVNRWKTKQNQSQKTRQRRGPLARRTLDTVAANLGYAVAMRRPASPARTVLVGRHPTNGAAARKRCSPALAPPLGETNRMLMAQRRRRSRSQRTLRHPRPGSYRRNQEVLGQGWVRAALQVLRHEARPVILSAKCRRTTCKPILIDCDYGQNGHSPFRRSSKINLP